MLLNSQEDRKSDDRCQMKSCEDEKSESPKENSVLIGVICEKRLVIKSIAKRIFDNVKTVKLGVSVPLWQKIIHLHSIPQ